MILKPLRSQDFGCLNEIFAKRIEESNLQERSSVDYALRSLERGYAGRYMGAYVDDFEKPTCCLIMSHFPGMSTSGVVAFINLIYIDPEHRGRSETAKVLMQTAENYARLNSANVLIGTSWLYRGSKGSDSFWQSRGFEVQETQYVKHLT
jgi:GNAT superfamily N-acetyltransferase